MEKKFAILIRKLLVGKANRDEANELNEWYSLKAGVSSGKKAVTTWKIIRVRMWDRVESQISPQKRLVPVYHQLMRPAIAASILIAIGLTAYFYMAGDSLLGIRKEITADHIISTSTGEIKKITLADSTNVWLNAHSSLIYSEKYGKKDRRVKLLGEAYFDVAHDAGRPFKVYTEHSVTRVLGTQFSVRAYKGENQQVGVTSGKVAVKIKDRKSKTDYQLLPGDNVKYDPTSKTAEQGHIDDPEMFMAWRNDVLYFDSLPLAEVAATLERKFGIRVRISDEQLARRKFRGTFKNTDLPRIMRSISLSMGLAINQVDATTVEIMKKDN